MLDTSNLCCRGALFKCLKRYNMRDHSLQLIRLTNQRNNTREVTYVLHVKIQLMMIMNVVYNVNGANYGLTVNVQS